MENRLPIAGDFFLPCVAAALGLAAAASCRATGTGTPRTPGGTRKPKQPGEGGLSA